MLTVVDYVRGWDLCFLVPWSDLFSRKPTAVLAVEQSIICFVLSSGANSNLLRSFFYMHMHMLTCVLSYARLIIMGLFAYFSRCFPSSFPVFAPCFQHVYFLSFENVCLLSFALARFLGRLVATKLIVKELVHNFRFQSVPYRLSNSILCSLLHLYTLLLLSACYCCIYSYSMVMYMTMTVSA